VEVRVYAPVEGKEQDAEEFYRELKQSKDKIPKKENIILAGDFNGRLVNQPTPECMGLYGEQVTNRNGATLRDFCAFHKLKNNQLILQKQRHTQIYLGDKRDQVNNRLHNYEC